MFDNNSRSKGKVKALAQTRGLVYPQLVQDPAQKLHLTDIQGLPVTFIFDPNGKLVKTLVGPQKIADLEAVIGMGITK